jgi:hypothetical protein
MSCALIGGYTKDCADSRGGVKAVYITELANKGSITAAAGVISAFTLATGKQFWKFEQELNVPTAKEDVTANRQNGTVFYAQEVMVQLQKLSAANRNHVKLLAVNDVMTIVEDRNGKFWLYGENNGLRVSGGSIGTGAASGDFNGSSLTFTGEEGEPAQEVTSSLMTALQVAAV